jgi:hypothetical protein
VPPAAEGVFGVQLAAVGERAQVEPEWRRLAARYPQLARLELQPPQQVEVPGKGTFYRVIGGPLASRAEADSLCVQLRAAGASCRLARP